MVLSTAQKNKEGRTNRSQSVDMFVDEKKKKCDGHFLASGCFGKAVLCSGSSS